MIKTMREQHVESAEEHVESAEEHVGSAEEHVGSAEEHVESAECLAGVLSGSAILAWKAKHAAALSHETPAIAAVRAAARLCRLRHPALMRSLGVHASPCLPSHACALRQLTSSDLATVRTAESSAAVRAAGGSNFLETSGSKLAWEQGLSGRHERPKHRSAAQLEDGLSATLARAEETLRCINLLRLRQSPDAPGAAPRGTDAEVAEAARARLRALADEWASERATRAPVGGSSSEARPDLILPTSSGTTNRPRRNTAGSSGTASITSLMRPSLRANAPSVPTQIVAPLRLPVEGIAWRLRACGGRAALRPPGREVTAPSRRSVGGGR